MLLVAAAAVAGLVAVAGPAQAVPPGAATGSFVLPGTDDVGDEKGFCSFPVQVEYVNNQRYVQEVTGTDGSLTQHLTGYASVIVTNLDNTENSLTYIASGPGKYYYPNADDPSTFSLDAAGPNLLWTTVANSYPGVPQLAYSTGHVQFSVESNLTTSYKLSGPRTDVCAALA